MDEQQFRTEPVDAWSVWRDGTLSRFAVQVPRNEAERRADSLVTYETGCTRPTNLVAIYIVDGDRWTGQPARYWDNPETKPKPRKR